MSMTITRAGLLAILALLSACAPPPPTPPINTLPPPADLTNPAAAGATGTTAARPAMR
jgi:hypothetical protein